MKISLKVLKYGNEDLEIGNYEQSKKLFNHMYDTSEQSVNILKAGLNGGLLELIQYMDDLIDSIQVHEFQEVLDMYPNVIALMEYELDGADAYYNDSKSYLSNEREKLIVVGCAYYGVIIMMYLLLYVPIIEAFKNRMKKFLSLAKVLGKQPD